MRPALGSELVAVAGMAPRGIRRTLCACALIALSARVLAAQQVDASLLEEIRRGPAAIELNGEVLSVPIVGSRTLPLLEVLVNGRGPYRMLIDFGANVILLRDSVARHSNARMILDRERSDILRVEEMKVGKATFRDVVVGATDNLDVDGVLGFNFFRDLLVEIDFPKMKLELSRGRLPDPDGREILPYEVEERMPFLPVTIGGRKVSMNFDTGAVGWFVIPPENKEGLPFGASPVPGPKMWNNQTGWTRVETARLAADLRFGRYTVATPRMEIDAGASFPFFGCALLQRFVLTFDIPNRRVRIQGPSERISVPGFRTFGIQLRSEAGQWRISDVIPGSRAAALQIREGEVVVAVDGMPAGKLTRESWSSIQQNKKKVRIELSRAGRRKTYVLPLQVLG